MRPYHDYAQKLIRWLGDVTLQHVRRTENKKDDALATLASTLTLPDQTQVIVCKKWIVPPSNEEEYIENMLDHRVTIVEAAKEDWRQPVIDYLCYGILPENPRRRTDIHHRAPRFLYYKDILYRRSFEVCYYDVWERKKQFKLYKKHTQEYVDHINLDQNFIFT